MPAAARKTDPIAHTSLLANIAKMAGSLVVGAVVGAALTALVAAAAGVTVATGGLAVLAIGFAVSVAMEASGLNESVDNTINDLVDSLIPPSIEGAVASGSADVRINSLRAARAAYPSVLDTVECAMHGAPPPMIAQGSDNVFINSQPAARVGDKTTCGGTIATGSGDVFIGGGTATVREIADERPWWLRALGIGIGVALALCGRGKLNFSALKAALPCLLMNFGVSMAGTAVGHAIRNFIGHPVNVVTGGKVLREEPDFDLPGPLALEWARFYSSHDTRSEGLFGPGWSVAYEVELVLEHDVAGALAALHYCDEQGRRISFPPVAPGTSHYSTAEGYYLTCTDLGQYVVESIDGIYRDFGIARDAFGGTLKLRRLEDRNGNWQALRYDAGGRLRQINDGCGRRLEMVYDTVRPARLAEVRLAKGAPGETTETLVQYRYSAQGELAEVTERGGHPTRRFVYERGLMTEHSAPGGIRSFYQWDGHGASARVARHWTDDGESYDFRYDLAQRTTVVTDQLGRLYRWEWNADCQPTMYTDPEGHAWRYEWDDNRQLVRMTDPAGAVTRREYDEAGWLTSTHNALGQIERTEWHPTLNQPTAEIDPAGNRWVYDYDERGNLVRATDPAGFTTEQHYDSRGLPHTIRDARGGYKSLEWSERAQLVGYTDCSGKRTGFAYDGRGALARVTDALGNATRYRSDALGRVTEIVQPDDSVHKFEYDQLGRVAAVIEPGGRQTKYQRNARGSLTRRIDALGHSVRFMYDRAHRLERLINENGEAYRFGYDRNDNLVEEIGLDGVARRIELDQRGLPVAVIDAFGHPDALTLRLQRDVLGRLVKKHARGRSTLYRYDQAGQLIQAQLYTDQGGKRVVHDDLLFSYGQRGELLSETGHMGILRHQYDELGNRIATTLPDGRTINSLYYGSGHLHQINIDGEVITDIERDDLHREIARTQGQLTSRFGYDRLGRKAWEQAELRGGRAPVLRKEWLYDEAGEVRLKRHSRDGVTEYLYDPLGRIVSAVHEAQRELFQWDAAANLVDSERSGGYVKHNRVMVFEDKRFEYDTHGRLAIKMIGSHTEQRFFYDGEHRLREVEVYRRGVRQRVHFEYDALGRRIRKTDAFGTTLFAWDGLQMLQECRGSEVTTYLYTPESYEPLARIDSQGAGEREKAKKAESDNWDAPLKATASECKVYYFHNDLSGLPEELTGIDAQLTWHAEFTAWGNTVSEFWSDTETRQGAESIVPHRDQNLRFQGQYLDREIGLHYNTFRFYDPSIGRYISPDPIGLAGGLNLFQYSPNPLGWIDPWGLTCKSEFSSARGRAKATHDLKQNGYTILHEEVTIKVNGVRIRADVIAKDPRGNIHVFEVKHGSGGLTPNQKASGVFDMKSPSNSTLPLGGGTIRPGQGTKGVFTVATGNPAKNGQLGQRGTVHDALFHILIYN